MLRLRRAFLILVIGLFMCTGLFAQDIMDQYFDARTLNDQIEKLVRNVSNLLPDSTTLQNVWSLSPSNSGNWFALGASASISWMEMSQVSKIRDGLGEFADNHNITRFPTDIPFLPGVAFDLRFGRRNIDFGFTGMWLNENILIDWVGTSFLGEGSHFSYRQFGFDFRYLLYDGTNAPKPLIPNVYAHAGYYFTWINFGIAAGSEWVDTEFVNDSFVLGAQVSSDAWKVALFRPYLGIKMIASKTYSGYEWQTQRPVMIDDEVYLNGANYVSGGKEGDFYLYCQLYGGVGINFALPHLLTLGVSYNPVTDHFSVNMSLRLILGRK